MDKEIHPRESDQNAQRQCSQRPLFLPGQPESRHRGEGRSRMARRKGEIVRARDMRSCTSARISQGRMRATSGLRMRLQRTASTRSAAASTQPTRRVLRKTNSTAVSAAQMKPASPRWVKKSIPASKIWVRSPCKTVRSISSTFIKRSLSRFVVYRIPEVYE